MRYSQRIAIVVLPTLAVAWLIAHEGHVALPTRGAQVDAETGTIILSRESREALDVRAVDVSIKGLPQSLSGYANLTSPWGKRAFASSRLPGRIAKLPTKPGERVAAGNVLAEIESLELEQLQLDILMQRTDLALARQQLESLTAAKGSVSEQEIRDTQNKVTQLENAVQVNRLKWVGLGLPEATFARLVESGQRESLTLPVVAPIGGTIVHADLVVGKVIDPTEHLFEIVDLGSVWAEIGILERDLQLIKSGQQVELRLTAYPGETFAGTIRSVDLALDGKTGVATAWAEFRNESNEPRLLPGLSGQVTITTATPSSNDRTVPTAAIIDDGVTQFVLVEEASAEKQSEYRRRNVAIARSAGSQTVIRSAELLPGDRVVERGAHELGGFFPSGVLRLSAEAQQTIGLKTTAAEVAPIADIVMLEGLADLPPNRRGQVSTSFAGTLLSLAVERGQKVEAEQVIATVASLDFQNLQLDFLRESLSLSLVKAQVQSLRGAKETIARRRLQEAEALLATTRARIESLRAKLLLVGLDGKAVDAIVAERRILNALPIRATLAGTVVGFSKSLGQYLKIEEPILEIHDISKPQVQVLVPENAVRRVAVGQSARVRFISDPNETSIGNVVRSARMLTTADQALAVWIELDAVKTTVRQNQLARVSIETGPGVSVLSVPRTAIITEGTRSFVFVRKADGTFDRVPVGLGRRDDRRVEITSGLKPADEVASAGVAGLQTAYASVR